MTLALLLEGVGSLGPVSVTLGSDLKLTSAVACATIVTVELAPEAMSPRGTVTTPFDSLPDVVDTKRHPRRKRDGERDALGRIGGPAFVGRHREGDITRPEDRARARADRNADIGRGHLRLIDRDTKLKPSYSPNWDRRSGCLHSRKAEASPLRWVSRRSSPSRCHPRQSTGNWP